MQYVSLAYSNAHRGAARKREQPEPIHEVRPVDEPRLSSIEYRRSWAMLIKKAFEVDPLTCMFCTGEPFSRIKHWSWRLGSVSVSESVSESKRDSNDTDSDTR